LRYVDPKQDRERCRIGTKLFGIESWVALSAADKEREPDFD
jgi:hypothetical protein